jgi:divalent metal cation (Fe/Co/Zn/Cd) transporter
VAKAAIPLLRKGLNMLLDRALEEPLVEGIRHIAESHNGRVNGVHELKTRRSGDTRFVEFHLVFDEDITLREAHRIADEIEMRIRLLENGLWIINIHLDPVDDSNRDRKLAKADGRISGN